VPNIENDAMALGNGTLVQGFALDYSKQFVSTLSRSRKALEQIMLNQIVFNQIMPYERIALRSRHPNLRVRQRPAEQRYRLQA
jgi:hypothetical protein